MHPLRTLAAVSVLLVACAPSRATTPPAAPRSEPAPTARPPAPPAPPTITRISAGGWPGSNTHQWGSRFFEVRGEGSAREIRIHDAIEFQGSGMTPAQMPPTRHQCTPWEPLPATQEVTALAIESWLKQTERPQQPAPPGAPTMPSSGTFGRGWSDCG